MHYESKDILRGRVEHALLGYMVVKTSQYAAREHGVEDGISQGIDLMVGDNAAINQFQVGTYVDPEDDRFGYALILSPLDTNPDRDEVKAAYFKGDRETGEIVEEPLFVSLKIDMVTEKVELDESRATDSDDYQRILHLMGVAVNRALDPEAFPLDPKMDVIIKQQYIGRLAAMYGNSKNVRVGTEDVEIFLADAFDAAKELFKDYRGNEVFIVQGVDTKDATRVVLITRDENDYLIKLLDDCDEPRVCRQFAIGPYAADMLDKEMHLGEIVHPGEKDIEDIVRIVSTGSLLSKENAAQAIQAAQSLISEEIDRLIEREFEGDIEYYSD